MNEGFAPGIGEKLRSYVYLLVDPRTGRAFYAGRGRNDRCFRHVQAARSDRRGAADGALPGSEGGRQGPPAGGEGDERGPAGGGERVPEGRPAGAGRGYPVLGRIREIESSGRSGRIDILRYGLSADEARLVEAVAGTPSVWGRHQTAGPPPAGPSPDSAPRRRCSTPGWPDRPSSSAATGSRSSARAGRSARISEAQLDEAIGSEWKIGRRWTDPRSPRSPQWAFVVVDDLVRAVLRIDGWKPAESTPPMQPPPVPGTSARWRLTGERDPEMERKYRGRNVSAYLSPGSQNPVTYVWCGPHWVNRPI